MISIVGFKDVICTVNTQHECEKYGCQPIGLRLVRREQVTTSMVVPVVEHSNHLECKVLNSAQMCDARHTSHFRIPSQPLNFETTVLRSAAKEIDKQKNLASSTGSLTTGRARGRGRRAVSSASGSYQSIGHGLGRGRG